MRKFYVNGWLVKGTHEKASVFRVEFDRIIALEEFHKDEDGNALDKACEWAKRNHDQRKAS